MQELVMTTEFTPTPLVPSGRFPSSSFCVFSNRLVAMTIAAAICVTWRGGLRGAAPPLAYIPCSLTNTLSSWAQYSALRYVSFPLQSISKSGKVVPVMIMGRFVTGVTYSTVEYIDAVLITCGVLLFSLSQLDSDFSSNAIGIILLGVYVTADSFTSQYQSKIYKTYGKVDQYHMMFGINMWSTCISLASIIIAGALL
jgi:adenosine 3'-phospho 5'-phosphosulfate transporter B2